jgi:hypothetical protein
MSVGSVAAESRVNRKTSCPERPDVRIIEKFRARLI